MLSKVKNKSEAGRLTFLLPQTKSTLRAGSVENRDGFWIQRQLDGRQQFL